MCIPFLGLFNNCYGGRPMNMAYDMIHGGLAGSMNLMFNQVLEHSMTFPTLYSMPQNIFNFSPYGGYGSNNDYLLDPRFPIIQSQMGMIPGMGMGMGMGMGLMPGMGMMPGMDMQEMWNRMMGLGGSTGSTDSATTRKYNKMLSLLKNLVNSDEISQSVKDEITDAIRNNKGKTEEKLERLTEVYNRIDKDELKNALKEANKIAYASKSTAEKDSFRVNLEKIGFEYEDGAADGIISDVYEAVTQIKKNGSQANPMSLEGAVTKDNILDFLSSWNSEYADSSTKSDKRILSHIAKYYNNMTDDKDTARANMINPLVDALKDKAREVKAGLPKSEKAKVEAAVKDLDEAFKTKNKITDDMIKAYDKLYVVVRMAALAKFNNEVTKYYGELDEDLFNSELFTEETIEDLKEEGFTKTAIEEADEDVTVDETEEDEEVEETDETDETEETGSTSGTTATTSTAAAEIGKSLFKDLNGYTSDDDWSNILLTMKQVNSKNVLAVLKDFNHRAANDFWTNGAPIFGIGHQQNFFEWVEREAGHASDRCELQRTMLNAVIEAIDENKKKLSKADREAVESYKEDLEAQLDKIGAEGEKFNANLVDKIVNKVIAIIVK